MKKLAVICAKGLDNFLDWIEPLKQVYDVRLFVVSTEQELSDASLWAGKKGIVWLEWCNDVAVYLTKQAHQSLWRDRRIIIRLHSYEVFERFPRQVAWDVVNDLVFVAPHMEEIFKELHPDVLPGTVKTHVIPNGIDIDNIDLVEDRDPHQIAVVGSINHKKNPQMVPEILDHLVSNDPAYHVHWAGAFQDLRYKVYLGHIIKEMDIEKNITFYSHIDDMNAFWQGKGALLHTSIHEGHSYAIMEAMARGIPPVIHNYRGAGGLYSPTMLFNTAEEAVKIITAYDFRPRDVREHITANGWTLKTQSDNIKAMLGA